MEERDGKPTKVLKRVDGLANAKSNDRSTWGSAEAVHGTPLTAIGGVGFVVSEDDPFCGIDLDHCLHPETGEFVNPEAERIVRDFNSYTEITPSREGVRIWIKARVPQDVKHVVWIEDQKVEVYDRVRFFTVTGQRLDWTPATIENRQGKLDRFVQLKSAPGTAPAEGPRCESSGYSDQEVIERTLGSENGDRFARLLRGDISDYHDDDSVADMAFCGFISWARDYAQIERLWVKALWRPKLDRQEDYRRPTIEKALRDPAPPPPLTMGRPTQESAPTEASKYFITAAEQAAREAEPIHYVAAPYFAKGCITNVIARVKMGKTTFMVALVAAKVHGGSFLGEVLEQGPVVYLTEERPATFRKALQRAGIDNDPNTYICYRSAVTDKEWAEIVTLARAQCKAVGAELLVVDTVPRWARVADDDENDGGAARAAMEPLERAAAEGLAVACGFHARKSGGNAADALAGSREWSGSADVILQITKPSGGGHEPTVREIESEGRLDLPNDRVLIERLKDGTFIKQGTKGESEARHLWKWIYDRVGDNADCTLADLVTMAKEESGGFSRSAIAGALLRMDGIRRSGTGRKNHPFTYRVAGLTIEAAA